MSSTASLPRKRTAQHDAARLFARYRRDHDRATRDALVARFLPLGHHLARRYHGGADADDLQQVASLGLLKAIERFDPERGLAFTSFAVPTILGELKRYFRDHGWTVRVPRDVQELKLRVDAISQTLSGELGRSTHHGRTRRARQRDDRTDPRGPRRRHRPPPRLAGPAAHRRWRRRDRLPRRHEPGFERVDDAAFVDGLLNTLSDRERMILRLRFENDLTQAEIGDRLGLSQMHVSRLIRQAITTLQATTAANQGDPSVATRRCRTLALARGAGKEAGYDHWARHSRGKCCLGTDSAAKFVSSGVTARPDLWSSSMHPSS